MQRQILIPGLQPRTANGSTGANQFLGQVEAGYKVGVYAPALATLTPFGAPAGLERHPERLQRMGGANSLNLIVAQQTTNSLRTTIGADLAGAIGFGDTRTLDLALRLGWQHEFADTGRPITAAFAAAPANAFTVYGATPQRDSAIIGFRPAPASRRRPRFISATTGDRQRHRQPRPQCRRAHDLVKVPISDGIWLVRRWSTLLASDVALQAPVRSPAFPAPCSSAGGVIALRTIFPRSLPVQRLPLRRRRRGRSACRSPS